MVESRHFPKRFRLIVWSASFLVGIAGGSLISQPVGHYWWGGAMAALGLALIVKRLSGLILGAAIAGLAGLILAAGAAAELTLPADLDYAGPTRVESVRFSQAPRERVILRLLAGPHRGADVRLLTYDWGFAPGSRVLIKMVVQPNIRRANAGYNILGTATEVGDVSWLSGPMGLDAVRAKVQRGIGASLPEPYASLAVGLLTGAHDEFDADFKQDLQRTGTTHLVAVSGYNLTIVALLVRRLGSRFSPQIGLWGAVGSLAGYILLAGASPSILRAAIVAALSLLAVASGRLTHRLPLLLVGAAILAAVTPLGLMYNLGWQLSFLAFAGIVFVQPLLEPWAKRLLVIGPSLGETLAAEIMVLPLLLRQFGIFSVVSLPVNAAVLALAPLAMGLSAMLAVAAIISVTLGRLVSWLAYPVLVAMVKPIQWASDLPFAALTLGKFPLSIMLGAYGVILVWLYTDWRRRVPID